MDIHSHFLARLRWYLYRFIVLLLLVTIVLVVYVYYPVMNFSESEFISRKGSLQTVKITRQWQEHHSLYTEAVLIASTGLSVEILLRRPENQNAAAPVVVLLGGAGTGRSACRLITTYSKLICASINYPYHGKKKPAGIEYLLQLHAMQAAIQDTPAAILLLLDYLARDADVDTGHIELVGVSLGAFLVSIPAVLDERVRRVWLVQGAAEPVNVIRHNYLNEFKPEFMGNIAAQLLGWSLGSHYIDPQKWIGRFSPRPVVIINSEKDEALPRSSVIQLHAAAKQPKEIIWTSSEHIRPTRQDIIDQLSEIVIKRIEQSD